MMRGIKKLLSFELHFCAREIFDLWRRCTHRRQSRGSIGFLLTFPNFGQSSNRCSNSGTVELELIE